MNLYKNITTTTSAFFLFSSCHVLADLHLPNSVDLIVVNGKKVKEVNSVSLPKGDNQLVIRYNEVLRSGTKKKKFQSRPFVITLNVDESEADMRIQHKRFREYDIASSAFRNDKVEWRIVINGEESPLSVNKLSGNKGLMPYQDIEKAVAKYNFEHGIRLTSTQLKDAAVNKPKSALNQVELIIEDKFVTDIKKWYLRASGEERKALLKWMIEKQ